MSDDLNAAIRGALATLDPGNDEHWTKNEAPLVEVVAKIVGQPELTRAQITEAAPLFTRTNPVLEPQEGPPEPPQAPQGGRGPEEPPEAPKFEQAPSSTPEPEFDEDEVAELRASIRDIDDDIARNAARIGDIQRKSDKLQGERDSLIRQVEKITRASSNQEGIMNYIRQQHANRMERAMRRDQALRGLDPEDLQSSSPLDSSMQRKNKRGAGRPERPPMNPR